jgi:hypothetical protein
MKFWTLDMFHNTFIFAYMGNMYTVASKLLIHVTLKHGPTE